MVIYLTLPSLFKLLYLVYQKALNHKTLLYEISYPVIDLRIINLHL